MPGYIDDRACLWLLTDYNFEIQSDNSIKAISCEYGSHPINILGPVKFFREHYHKFLIQNDDTILQKSYMILTFDNKLYEITKFYNCDAQLVLHRNNCPENAIGFANANGSCAISRLTDDDQIEAALSNNAYFLLFILHDETIMFCRQDTESFILKYNVVEVAMDEHAEAAFIIIDFQGVIYAIEEYGDVIPWYENEQIKRLLCQELNGVAPHYLKIRCSHYHEGTDALLLTDGTLFIKLPKTNNWCLIARKIQDIVVDDLPNFRDVLYGSSHNILALSNSGSILRITNLGKIIREHVDIKQIADDGSTAVDSQGKILMSEMHVRMEKEGMWKPFSTSISEVILAGKYNHNKRFHCTKRAT